MRLPSVRYQPLSEPPLWPPLLATRGAGGASAAHSHHGMHLVVARRGELRVFGADKKRWQRAAGVITGPDAPHAVDASNAEILLVFLDPESEAGLALQAALRGPLRLIDRAAASELADADPMAIMRGDGVEWTVRAIDVLGGRAPVRRRSVHPRVRRVIAQLRTLPVEGDVSLEALAKAADLSPGRLMHAFTQSIGIPLRPYIAWLKLQRAAAAVAGGAGLSAAAASAGFADAAHMSRTFHRMFGVAPSTLRAQIVAS